MARRNRAKNGASKKSNAKRAGRELRKGHAVAGGAGNETASVSEGRLDDLIARLQDFEDRFARWEQDLAQFSESLGPTAP